MCSLTFCCLSRSFSLVCTRGSLACDVPVGGCFSQHSENVLPWPSTSLLTVGSRAPRPRCSFNRRLFPSRPWASQFPFCFQSCAAMRLRSASFSSMLFRFHSTSWIFSLIVYIIFFKKLLLFPQICFSLSLFFSLSESKRARVFLFTLPYGPPLFRILFHLCVETGCFLLI